MLGYCIKYIGKKGKLYVIRLFHHTVAYTIYCICILLNLFQLIKESIIKVFTNLKNKLYFILKNLILNFCLSINSIYPEFY